MPCHVLYHPDCPTCTAPRDAEDKAAADKFIRDNPGLSDQAQQRVRATFSRKK